MKEICLDARLILCSGIGTYLKNLLKNFQNTPFKLRVVVSKDAVKKLPWLEKFDLILHSSPLYSLHEQAAMPLIIPRCDLFWSPHFNIPFLPIRAKKRLATIHDAYHLAHFSTLKLHEKAYAKIAFSRAVKSCDKIITVSQFSKGELLKYTSLPPHKLKVIYLGADHLKKSGDLKKMPPFFLYVGNVKPHKNVKRLIHAFTLVQKRGFTDFKLFIVGKRKGFNTSESLGNISGESIHFLEEVEDADLPLYYQNAEMLIFPSLYEGFGLPPLEAMSSGCPTIVSKCGSLPEICADAAYFVDAENEESIAGGMIDVLTNKELKEDLKQKGLTRSRLFTWKKTAEAHIQTIEESLSL